LKAGIWKLKWIRRGLEKGRCPLCGGEEDAKHILLKCKESKKWREEWANNNWPNINEDLVYNKIICCTNVNRIKLLGKYLFKVKRKWKNKVRGGLKPTPKDYLVRGGGGY
jgi:hypothetical protein